MSESEQIYRAARYLIDHAKLSRAGRCALHLWDQARPSHKTKDRRERRRVAEIDDAVARDLLRRADRDNMPMYGRSFVVTGSLGTLYGANVVAGHDGKQTVRLICRGADREYHP